jgi:hypothetical protein
VNGIADFSGLMLSTDGEYSLLATDSETIPSIVSPPFFVWW